MSGVSLWINRYVLLVNSRALSLHSLLTGNDLPDDVNVSRIYSTTGHCSGYVLVRGKRLSEGEPPEGRARASGPRSSSGRSLARPGPRSGGGGKRAAPPGPGLPPPVVPLSRQGGGGAPTGHAPSEPEPRPRRACRGDVTGPLRRSPSPSAGRAARRSRPPAPAPRLGPARPAAPRPPCPRTGPSSSAAPSRIVVKKYSRSESSIQTKSRSSSNAIKGRNSCQCWTRPSSLSQTMST